MLPPDILKGCSQPLAAKKGVGTRISLDPIIAKDNRVIGGLANEKQTGNPSDMFRNAWVTCLF